MRRVIYSVAASLDGFIAGPNGEYDWITQDPDFAFGALYAQFDTLLMGRKTYEMALRGGQSLASMGMKIVVVSTTLKAAEHPGVEIISNDVAQAVADLKAGSGAKAEKDIWLFGGAALFRSLLDADRVDGMRFSIMPVMLGSGVPLLPAGLRVKLQLEKCRALKSGIVCVDYRRSR